MKISALDQQLCRSLRALPKEFNNRYDGKARRALQQILFRSLMSGKTNFLTNLFNNQLPGEDEDWHLQTSQGISEGAEYTEAARGKACGHIFKSGEASYRCKTCTVDDTCVLCAKCFEASDHSGHMVYVSVSPGNSGCCDCGDLEAWRCPVNCAIHTLEASERNKIKAASNLPIEVGNGIRMTIGTALDYFCDVMSCSPEQLRLPKSEDSITLDESMSRLVTRWFDDGDEPETEPEFALVLWNDEKHTVTEVENQVARACREAKAFGLAKANETDEVGRSVVTYSKDLDKLLKIAKIIEHIKITVTIRSARDTFREQMCSTIVEWLRDISGCSVGSDHDILKQTICQELLKTWRTGSEATNAQIARDGIYDHEIEEGETGLISGGMHRVIANITTNENGGVIIDVAGIVGEPDLIDESEGVEGDDEADDADDVEIQDLIDESEDLMDIDPEEGVSSDADGDLHMRTLMGDDAHPEPEGFHQRTPPPRTPATRPPRVTRGVSGPGQPSPAWNSPQTTPRVGLLMPQTPHSHSRKTATAGPPTYWLKGPNQDDPNCMFPEDLSKRVRVDWMVLFDLRMWKKTRVDLRDLYISTVVTVPSFKRILGLRFAALYPILAQLYLVADREPDHSIIYMSLQMLTTPSITQEVVAKGNFLTSLIAILYTFLTTRQVGDPSEVAPDATLAFDAGSVQNRRMYHFFMDLKHLFASEYVQRRLREDENLVMQFLDLTKLPQGICPNVRAVGEHVEYETDAWISASLLTREVNRLCRQFADSFGLHKDRTGSALLQTIELVAKATIINSLGLESSRFEQSEARDTNFKHLSEYRAVLAVDGLTGFGPSHDMVVDFVVDKEPISFHHALHYTLSWLIDGAKIMSVHPLRRMMLFDSTQLRQAKYPLSKSSPPVLDPETYLLVLFDYPLRVCAWIAQMKAGMWVRNGMSLRHQMSTYRGVAQRELAYQRDIFLLQVAMVICHPSRMLLSMIDRFAMTNWMTGQYSKHLGFEEGQMLDVAEDLIQLLIVLLCDRTGLHTGQDEEVAQLEAMQKDIAHILCFKPLSYSELANRLGDRFSDREDFPTILNSMTIFKSPEGMTDTGSFELRQEFITHLDPYIAHYSKNQRDEAETIFRTWLAGKKGKPVAEVVFEPTLRPIRLGIFRDLAGFTRTALFSQIVFFSVNYTVEAHKHNPSIPTTRTEAYLHVVLHLILVAIHEDMTDEDDSPDTASTSFVYRLLHKTQSCPDSTFSVLQKLSAMEEYRGCHTKIRAIIVRVQQKRPMAIARIAAARGIPMERLGSDSPSGPSAEDLELKKQQALERQARVMAQFQSQQQDFMKNQTDLEDDSEDLADDASVDMNAADEQKQTWKYPSGNCILCQEETNDSRCYGTFALLMESNILRQTQVDDVDYLQEVLDTPASLDRSADRIRPFGVSGKNRVPIRKFTSDGKEIIAERQELGKGFPKGSWITGPVSTGCGHIMHYKCFETCFAAAERRQVHQIARNHPERIAKKEFVCPLCKALGNAFLPIIWKGTEECYPGALQTEQPFDEWLQIGLASRLQQVVSDGKSPFQRHQQLFMDHVMGTTLASSVGKAQPRSNDPFSPVSGQFERLRMPGGPADEEITRAPSPPTNQGSTDTFGLEELFAIYNRLRETMRGNELSSRHKYPPPQSGSTEDLTHTDVLGKILGFSISAVEIAQRGVGCEPGTLLLDKIPSLSLTHLRILSETASSYFAFGGLRNSRSNKCNQEFHDTQALQLVQLFVGHPLIYGNAGNPWALVSPPVQASISRDAFLLLAEYSLFLIPALRLDVHHFVRLFYIMEVVKVAVMELVQVAAMFRNERTTSLALGLATSDLGINPAEESAMRSFLRQIETFAGTDHCLSISTPAALAQLLKRVSTYTMVFMRKSVLLLHVRYGVNFPNTGFSDMHDSELVRLAKALRLPSLVEVFGLISEPAKADQRPIIQLMVRSWIVHWKWQLEKDQYKHISLKGIRLTHPAIFELIGLPKFYDALLEMMMKTKCPTTGKELMDPVVCLFCGEMFCSQAVCCEKGGFGGATQHRKRCAGQVGMFINIRKCMILLLHARNGSWVPAPYLDKHGEADAGLRRSRQLILNQKRYDALSRHSWLTQGIPTQISRKLEGEINNGGWETC